MKILFLQDDFPPFTRGGAGIIAFNFAKKIKEKGHDIYVISAVQNKSEEGEIDYEGLKVFKIYSNYHERFRAYLSIYNPLAVKKIKKIIKEIKPDITHAHNVHFHLSYYSFKLAKKYSAKVYLTAHDTMLVSYGKLFLLPQGSLKINFLKNLKFARKRFNPFRNLLVGHYLKYVDCIFTISEALKNLLSQNGIKNKIEILYNGIDINEWHSPQEKIEEFKNKFKIKNNKIIFFGGRLSGAKGGLEIIKSLSYIVNEKNMRDVILMIAGDKNLPFAKKMFEFAKSLNISDNIIFTGWLDRDEVKQAFFSSDVCVTPSIYFDPFNLFNIEAMAAKKPVVGTVFGGTAEIVTDNETGFIENPLDYRAFADKIIELLNNSKKAGIFGENGYRRAENFFSLEKQTDKLLKFYQIL